MKVIVLNKKDNVATALVNIKQGEAIDLPADPSKQSLIAQDNVPVGYKIAIRKIAKNDRLIKYGYPIGQANEDISRGELVHVHNVKSIRGKEYKERGRDGG